MAEVLVGVCPECEGDGIILVPGWTSAGDYGQGFIDADPRPCPTCNGKTAPVDQTEAA